MITKRSLLRLFLSLIIAVLLLLVLLSAYFLIQRNNTVVLPKPTGQFTVGRIGYDWVDDSRNEVYSETKDTKRKLSTWVWYPSDLNKNAKKTALSKKLAWAAWDISTRYPSFFKPL